MTKHKLAVIVPTKDRPEDIERFFGSLSSQEIQLDQVIVVDGGESSIDRILSDFKGLRVDYKKVKPASLTAQRNAGIKMLNDEITLVAFFDDDVVFEKDSFKNMIKFWKCASLEVGGASFNNMSEPFVRPNVIEKIFLVNYEKPGRILKSGFQSIPCALKETTKVEWLIGCAMMYRRPVLDEFSFDESLAGYARYEDVEFSYRIGKKYQLFVVADAKIKHLVNVEKTEDAFALARMEVINRIYFVNKNPDLSFPLCLWALFGVFLNYIVKAIMYLDKRSLNRARGNIAGFAAYLLKNTKKDIFTART